ncbi:hypothetical protein LCGC14_1573400 [marine sediment metagenome]|uniref:Uncharacterized protein n=1 Tax=marine sediment metagenome TaxID=412755 RepID=A0A0F9IJ42_9ZZZZ
MTSYEPLFISGHPRPKGSWTPVQTKQGIKFRPASNKTAEWCKSAKEQLVVLWGGPVLDGPIRVKLEFLVPRLKTVVRRYPTGAREGDIDKLMRSILDAMTGVVYKDDSQVIRSILEQNYTDSMPGVWVTISDDV